MSAQALPARTPPQDAAPPGKQKAHHARNFYGSSNEDALPRLLPLLPSTPIRTKLQPICKDRNAIPEAFQNASVASTRL